MMAGDPAAIVQDADVRSLAAKLKGWHMLLTPAEQSLLHAVLRRAAMREEPVAPDTTGFTWAVSFNPFIYLDVIAADAADEARALPVSHAQVSGRADENVRSREENDMTQITEEQWQQLDPAARSLAAKLQMFQDGLTADEQQVLGYAFGAIAATGAAEDVAGYAMQDGYVWKDGAGVVFDICLNWQGWRPGQPLPRRE